MQSRLIVSPLNSINFTDNPVEIGDGLSVKATRETAENDCGLSTFENHSSSASPKAEDCRQITRNIAREGSWNVGPFHDRTVVAYASCQFTISATIWTNIGNEDIIDIINDSIDKFQWEGKVGARGEMECGGNQIIWGIH